MVESDLNRIISLNKDELGHSPSFLERDHDLKNPLPQGYGIRNNFKVHVEAGVLSLGKVRFEGNTCQLLNVRSEIQPNLPCRNSKGVERVIKSLKQFPKS